MNNFERNLAERNLAEAIASFPATFGLRAFPGDTFRISRTSSYVNDTGALMLYTEIKKTDFGNANDWLSFAKGTPEELRREIVAVPK
jgi:hypothetical protein